MLSCYTVSSALLPVAQHLRHLSARVPENQDVMKSTEHAERQAVLLDAVLLKQGIVITQNRHRKELHTLIIAPKTQLSPALWECLLHQTENNPQATEIIVITHETPSCLPDTLPLCQITIPPPQHTGDTLWHFMGLCLALRMARGTTLSLLSPDRQKTITEKAVFPDKEALAALKKHPHAACAFPSAPALPLWRTWLHSRCGYPDLAEETTGLHHFLHSIQNTLPAVHQQKTGTYSLQPARPIAEKALVSVIIPVWNQLAHTRQCLEAVAAHTQYTKREIIVINNASEDGTQQALESMPDLIVITNPHNKGFTEACNQGAQKARGEYLLFLNNDTVPLHGWLERLVHCLDNAPQAWAAGSRLIYPDGNLQEAAAIVHRNGTASNYGRHDAPELPCYNIPSPVDYCSGASLLVRSAVFSRLGGFDMRYAPAYYEETDLCFAIREQGGEVVYEPASTVIHWGSTTAGLDPTQGARKYLALNRKKFTHKWASVLTQHEPAPNIPDTPGTAQKIITSSRHYLGKRLVPAHNASSAPSVPAMPDKQASAKISPRLIAFYLPQFHQIPENDNWWGKGFTEWTNVKKACPGFSGHQQPLTPTETGWYDLADKHVMHQQAALAQTHGIHGFCFYHYWFHGRQLLEKPVQQFLDSDISLPFCLCWANENWSRNWDGGNSELLIEQRHSPEDDRAHLSHLLNFMSDSRYITIEGKPLLLVYRAGLLPDPARTAACWQELAQQAGLPGLYLCKVEGLSAERQAPGPMGFDAAAEFQPDWCNLGEPQQGKHFAKHRVYDYRDFVKKQLTKPVPAYTRFPCVTPRWDNTPRRAHDSVILHKPSPRLYRDWLVHAIQQVSSRPSQEQLVFINAWNEWGEGSMLEPDGYFERAFLEAGKEALLLASLNSLENNAPACTDQENLL